MHFNLAQTFYVDKSLVQNADDIILTSIDLYFKSKPRDTNNQSGIEKPGVNIYLAPVKEGDIPNIDDMFKDSHVRLEYDDIVVGGLNAKTNFKFKQPIDILTNKSYAVVIAFDGQEDFALWTAKEGDIIYGTNISATGSMEKNVGKLYEYSSHVATPPISSFGFPVDPLPTTEWLPIKDTDLKFNVYCGRYHVSNDSINAASNGYSITYNHTKNHHEYITFDTHNSYALKGGRYNKLISQYYYTENASSIKPGDVIVEETPISELTNFYRGDREWKSITRYKVLSGGSLTGNAYVTTTGHHKNTFAGEMIYQVTPTIRGTVSTNSKSTIITTNNMNFNSLLTMEADNPMYLVLHTNNYFDVDSRNYNGRPKWHYPTGVWMRDPWRSDTDVVKVLSIDSNTQITLEKPPTFSDAAATMSISPVAELDHIEVHNHRIVEWDKDHDHIVKKRHKHYETLFLRNSNANSLIRFTNNTIEHISINHREKVHANLFLVSAVSANVDTVNAYMRTITYGGNSSIGYKFVAAGQNSGIHISADGVTWTDASVTDQDHHFFASTYGNNTFVLGGAGDVIYTSPNAQPGSWTKRVPKSTNDYYNITANTVGANNTAEVIYLTDANTKFSLNEEVKYFVPTGNTPIGGLTGNTNYFVSFVNTSALALSTTMGGANINITAATTNPAQVHRLIRGRNYRWPILNTSNITTFTSPQVYVNNHKGSDWNTFMNDWAVWTSPGNGGGPFNVKQTRSRMLTITNPGEYSFWFAVDDNAKVYLNDHPIIDENSCRTSRGDQVPVEKTYHLKAGTYIIRTEVYDTGGVGGWGLTVSPTNKDYTPTKVYGTYDYRDHSVLEQSAYAATLPATDKIISIDPHVSTNPNGPDPYYIYTVRRSPDASAKTAWKATIIWDTRSHLAAESITTPNAEYHQVLTPDRGTDRGYGIRGMAYGNGVHVAVGRYWHDKNRSYIAFSNNNGTNWYHVTYPGYDTAGPLRSVTYGNGLFVAVGANSFIKSTDGKTWSKTANSLGIHYGVTYGNGQFIAVGDNGIRTSPDGTTWTNSAVANTDENYTHLFAIAYGNNVSGDMFMAVGSKGSRDLGYILVSNNGVDWNRKDPPASLKKHKGIQSSFRGVAFGNSTFVLPSVMQDLRLGDVPSVHINSQDAKLNKIDWSLYKWSAGEFAYTTIDKLQNFSGYVNVVTSSTGSGYSNSDYIEIYNSNLTYSTTSANAYANIVTDSSGHIVNTYISNTGYGFPIKDPVHNIKYNIWNASNTLSTGTNAHFYFHVGSTLRTEHSGIVYSNTVVVDIESHKIVPHFWLSNSPHHSNVELKFSSPWYRDAVDDTIKFGGGAYNGIPHPLPNGHLVEHNANAHMRFSNTIIHPSRSHEVMYHYDILANIGALVPDHMVHTVVTGWSNNDFTPPRTDIPDVHNTTYIINDSWEDENTNTGNALCKHITTQINFEKGKNAEDLLVYLRAYRPPSTDIKVLARIHNSDDEDAFNDKDWTLLTCTGNKMQYSQESKFDDVVEYTYEMTKSPNTVFTSTGVLTLRQQRDTTFYGTGTSFHKDFKVNDLVKIESALFDVNYYIGYVKHIENDNEIEIDDGVKDVTGLVGDGSTISLIGRAPTTINNGKILQVGYPYQAFRDHDGVVKYFNKSMAYFKTFNTMQFKIILTAANPAIVPMVMDIRALGVSA